MKKKYVILLALLSLCFTSCNVRNPSAISIREEANFIIDTTLRQEHMDIQPFEEYDTTNAKKRIVSAEAAFERVKSSINNLIDEGIIGLQDTFHIHPIHDSIWITRNKSVSKTGEWLFGGGVYYEIRQADGCILKSIIEE